MSALVLGVGSVRDRILGPTRSTHGHSHARIRSTAGGARRDRRRRTCGGRGGAARKRLGATKGSFYWHFADREALVEAALADWEHSHTAAVIAEIETSSDDPLQQLRPSSDASPHWPHVTGSNSRSLQPLITRRRSRCSIASPAGASSSSPDASSASASHAPRRSDGRSSPTAPSRARTTRPRHAATAAPRTSSQTRLPQRRPRRADLAAERRPTDAKLDRPFDRP
jgi:AcrR family transcriptional regulator